MIVLEFREVKFARETVCFLLPRRRFELLNFYSRCYKEQYFLIILSKFIPEKRGNLNLFYASMKVRLRDLFGKWCLVFLLSYKRLKTINLVNLLAVHLITIEQKYNQKMPELKGFQTKLIRWIRWSRELVTKLINIQKPLHIIPGRRPSLSVETKVRNH